MTDPGLMLLTLQYMRCCHLGHAATHDAEQHARALALGSGAQIGSLPESLFALRAQIASDAASLLATAMIMLSIYSLWKAFVRKAAFGSSCRVYLPSD